MDALPDFFVQTFGLIKRARLETAAYHCFGQSFVLMKRSFNNRQD